MSESITLIKKSPHEVEKIVELHNQLLIKICDKLGIDMWLTEDSLVIEIRRIQEVHGVGDLNKIDPEFLSKEDAKILEQYCVVNKVTLDCLTKDATTSNKGEDGKAKIKSSVGWVPKDTTSKDTGAKK